MRGAPEASRQDLTKQTINNEVQAKKLWKKAERSPKGWMGIKDGALNGDREAGLRSKAKATPTPTPPGCCGGGRKGTPHSGWLQGEWGPLGSSRPKSSREESTQGKVGAQGAPDTRENRKQSLLLPWPERLLG